MNKFIFTALVMLLVTMNISVSALTSQGISGAEILFIRAIFNLILVFAVAGITKQKLLPTQPKLQFGAFICLGLSLLLVFTSYQYISAGSVSTLQRLDIPFLALFSLRKQFSIKKAVLSICAFVIVLFLVNYTKSTGAQTIGYILVLIAVIVTAVNTIIQKQIAQKENIVVIMLITSLSSIFWGGIRCWQTGTTFHSISTTLLMAIFGLALVNPAIFYLINELYKKHNPALVRYPYLIAAFTTMCVDMLIKRQWQNPVIITGNVLVLIVISLLLQTKPLPIKFKK